MFKYVRFSILSLYCATSMVFGQEIKFQRETNTIPVSIDGRSLSDPFAGGVSDSKPVFVDIDDDGDDDLLLGANENNIKFFLNTGSPAIANFTLKLDNVADRNLGVRVAPAVADIDNDGDFDLFVGNSSGDFYFYENIGTTTEFNFIFRSKNYQGISEPGDSAPAFADIDGDGLIDLFLGKTDAKISFYHNKGTSEIPDFELDTAFFDSIDVKTLRSSPFFADIDDDGDVDLFIGRNGIGSNFHDADILFYRNIGTPENHNFVLEISDIDPAKTASNVSPTLTDIDDDGDLDLFWGEQEGQLNFYENIGNQSTFSFTFVTDEFVYLDRLWHSAPVFADLNQNSFLDLYLGIGGLAGMRLYSNIGDASSPSFLFTSSRFAGINVTRPGDRNYNQRVVPIFADIDDDKDLDLFIGDKFGDLHFYRNDGTASKYSFQFGTKNYAFIQIDSMSAPTFADIDNDGDLDLFIGEYNGNINFYRNIGSKQQANFVLVTQFLPSTSGAIDVGTYSAPAFSDVDMDGDLDLFIGEGNANLNFFRNIGSQEVFSFVLEDENFTGTDFGWRAAPRFADIDNDGDEDLFVGLGGSGLQFFRNLTNPTQEPQSTLAAEAPENIVCGTEFWISVAVESVHDLFGASFDIDYETQYLDFIAAQIMNPETGEKSFLGDDLIFLPTPDNGAGKVSIGVSRKSGQGGVSGDGPLVWIKFKAVDEVDDTMEISWRLSNIAANDSDGSPKTLNSVESNSMLFCGCTVWPGDTNNDAVVAASDILPIGLFYGKTGPAREKKGCEWIGYNTICWMPEAATYADANGDGVVNAADLLCIGLNWNKTHNASLPKTAHTTIRAIQNAALSRLRFEFIGDANPGEDFIVEVHADSVHDLYGISFKLSLSPTATVTIAGVDTSGTFLGSNLLQFSQIDNDNGVVEVGLTKIAGSGVSGSGMIVRLHMNMSGDAAIGDSTSIMLTDIAANDSEGNAIPFKEQDKTEEIVTDIFDEDTALQPKKFTLFQNYPNPFNPETTIAFSVQKQAHVTLKIYNTLGQEVRTLIDAIKPEGLHRVVWDGRDVTGQILSSGVYIYVIQTDDYSDMKKMTFTK